MWAAVWMICITIIRVCTNTEAEDLPVGWIAPEPEGTCIQTFCLPMPRVTAMFRRGPPNMPAVTHFGKEIFCCLPPGSVTLRTLRQPSAYANSLFNDLKTSADSVLVRTRGPQSDAAISLWKQLSLPPVQPATYQQTDLDSLVINNTGPLILARIGNTKAASISQHKPARELQVQLGLQKVQRAQYSQQEIDQTASHRSGPLPLASLGDTKVQNRQHPAITGFPVCSPPMVSRKVHLQEVTELSTTPRAVVEQGIIQAVRSATAVNGQITARRMDKTVRTLWVDPENTNVRVVTATWEVTGPAGEDFVLKVLTAAADIRVTRWDKGEGTCKQGPATIRPVPPQEGQMEVGRSKDYGVECTAADHSSAAPLVQEILDEAARQAVTAEMQGQQLDSLSLTPQGMAAAMSILGMAEMQLLGVEACYTRQGHQVVRVIHGYALAVAFIEEVGGLDITVQSAGLVLTPLQPRQGPSPALQLAAGLEVSGFLNGSVAGDPKQQLALLELLNSRTDRLLQMAQQNPTELGFSTGSTIFQKGQVFLRDMRTGGFTTLENFCLEEQAAQLDQMGGILADSKGRPQFSLSPTEMVVWVNSSRPTPLTLSLADTTSVCLLMQVTACFPQPAVLEGVGLSARPWQLPGAPFLTYSNRGPYWIVIIAILVLIT